MIKTQLDVLHRLAESRWITDGLGPSLRRPTQISAAEKLLTPNDRATRAIGDERVYWLRESETREQMRSMLTTELDETYDDYINAIAPLRRRMAEEIRRKQKADAHDAARVEAAMSGELGPNTVTFSVIDFHFEPDAIATRALELERKIETALEHAWQNAISDGRVVRLQRSDRGDYLLMVDESANEADGDSTQFALMANLPKAVRKIASEGAPKKRGTRSLEAYDRPFAELAAELCTADPNLPKIKAVQQAVERIGRVPKSDQPGTYEPRIIRLLNKLLGE